MVYSLGEVMALKAEETRIHRPRVRLSYWSMCPMIRSTTSTGRLGMLSVSLEVGGKVISSFGRLAGGDYLISYAPRYMR